MEKRRFTGHGAGVFDVGRGLSLPEIIILRRVLKPQLIAYLSVWWLSPSS
jgi:hypothetical protein